MRALPTDLMQKLTSGVTTLALAWRFTRSDGLVIGATNHDRDLYFDDTHFYAASSMLGHSADSHISLTPNRSALSGALKIDAISQNDLAIGRWNGAKVEAFWVDWTKSSDFVAMWQGYIAGSIVRGSVFELDIVGSEAFLNKTIGQVYARTCDAVLGDARCRVDLSVLARKINRVVSSVISDRIIEFPTPLQQAQTDFANGSIRFENGPLKGWQSTIAEIHSQANAWRIQCTRPFPIAPLIGDLVIVIMGCDKQFSTCRSRFDNALNFRGQPHLPGDDVAFFGPRNNDNNGGKR